MGSFANLVGTVLATFGIGPKGARATLDASGLTADRTFTLPDKDGALPVAADVVDLTSSQNVSGQKTFTGTGGITAYNAAGAQVIVASAGGAESKVNFRAGALIGKTRWELTKNTTAEAGSEAGSDLDLSRFSDAGSVIGRVFRVIRSTGVLNFEVAPTILGNEVLIAGSNPNKLDWTQTVRAFALKTADTAGSGGSSQINVGPDPAALSSYAYLIGPNPAPSPRSHGRLVYNDGSTNYEGLRFGTTVTFPLDTVTLADFKPKQLTFDATATEPSAPSANNVVMFGRQVSGRNLPAFMGPSGLSTSVQPLLARNKVGYWCPPGNANTVPGVLGFTAPTVTGFTATARNVAATNHFTRMRRLGYVTGTTAGTVGHWRCNAYQYTTGGTGLGGFHYIIRFGISDATLETAARMFMGMRNSSTPSNVAPSTLTNCFGVGHDASETTLSFYYGGSAAQTPVSLGANFPVAKDVAYELALFAPPNETKLYWQVTHLGTGNTATGSVTGGAAVMPQESTLLAPWGYRTNNTAAVAVAIDVMSAYIETDL